MREHRKNIAKTWKSPEMEQPDPRYHICTNLLDPNPNITQVPFRHTSAGRKHIPTGYGPTWTNLGSGLPTDKPKVPLANFDEQGMCAINKKGNNMQKKELDT
jgi:hypothetical protein